MQLFLVRLANAFMGMSMFLADEPGTQKKWVTDITKLLRSIINPALIIAGTAGAVYAIILGVKMAKADDQTKRDEAKKNLINVLIAVVATILLILLFYMFVAWIEDGTINLG